MSLDVRVVRVYDSSRFAGEYRVLVDRLWPRGMTRASVDVDEWAKDATPSPALRKWYSHDTARFEEFTARYTSELSVPPGADVVTRLREMARARAVVLLTASRDVEHSAAHVLLLEILRTPGELSG